MTQRRKEKKEAMRTFSPADRKKRKGRNSDPEPKSQQRKDGTGSNCSWDEVPVPARSKGGENEMYEIIRGGKKEKAP